MKSRRMRNRIGSWGWAAAGLILLAGCRSAPVDPQRGAIFSDAEIQRFLKRAQDPRTYSLTVYQDARGVPVYTGGFRLYPGSPAELPFDAPPELPLTVLPVGCGAHVEGRVLVDTTTADTWVSMEQASRLRLVALGPPFFNVKPAHVLDNAPAFLSLVPGLTFGPLRMETVPAFARASHGPLWPLSRSAAAGPVDFVAGLSLLKAFAWVQWDYPARVWRAAPAGAYQPREETLLAVVPIESSPGGLMIKGRLDGKSAVFLVDTAGDFELAMDAPPMKLIRQISAGDLVFRQVKAVSTRDLALGQPDIPRIGARLLMKYRMTLDPRRNVLVFERPAGADRPAGEP